MLSNSVDAVWIPELLLKHLDLVAQRGFVQKGEEGADDIEMETEDIVFIF